MTARRDTGPGPVGRPAEDGATIERQPGGGRFWISAAIGWVIIVNGIRGALVNDVDTRPASLARFVIGGALVHDLVVAPLVILVGLVLARVLRRAGPLRTAVPVAAILSAVTVLFAYPLVRGFGRALRNPTSLPRNYGAGLALVIGAVWLATIVVLVVAWARQRRHPAATP